MIDTTLGEGGGVLEITLDAGPDADDSNESPKHIDHEYAQHTLKGITNSFTIFDDIYINQSLNFVNPRAFGLKFFKNHDIGKNRINLTYLDPKPTREVHVAWQWFFNGLAAIAWAFVVIYVGEYTDYSIAHDAMLPAGILLGTFGIVAFMVFYYKTQDKIVYSSFVGQVPVIELFHMPRNQAYNNFIDTIESVIYKAHHRNNITMKYRLIGELKHLRKIKETNDITNDEYEAARNKIFKHNEYQT